MFSKSLLITALAVCYNTSLVSSSPVITTPAATASALAPIPCVPAPYVATAGEVWTVQCGFNYYGTAPDRPNNVLLEGRGGFASLNACIDHCDTSFHNTCTVVDYIKTGGLAGYCFCLKNGSNGGVANDGVDSAVIQVSASSSRVVDI